MIYRVVTGGSRPVTLEVEFSDGTEPPASILAQMGAAAGIPSTQPASNQVHARVMGTRAGNPVDAAIGSEDLYGA